MGGPARSLSRERLLRLAYVLPAGVWAVVLLAMAVARDLGPLDQMQVVAHQDLAGHFVEYVVLGALLAFALMHATDQTPLEAFLVTVALGALYGLLLEGVQLFLPWRTASASDAVANTLGAVLGAAISIYVIATRRKR
jgi:VanZ family protein